MRIKGKKKLPKLNNAGMTLVEMIVSFVLLSIFMVAATALIGSITNIYYSVRGNSDGLKVANILMNKIRGELEDATMFISDDTGSIFDGGNIGSSDTIKFRKSDGSIVTLGIEVTGENAEKKYFVERFDEVKERDGSDDDIGDNSPNGSSNIKYKEVGWRFDEDVYMGYSISSILFSKSGGNASLYDSNVIKIELTLTSPQWGDYTTEKYVRCYQIR